MIAMPEPFGSSTTGAGGGPADEDSLACGASLADLVDQADSGRLEPVDAHQSTCPDCRQALRTAASADRAMGLLRETTGPVPVGLVESVMTRVRQTRPDNRLIELPESSRTGQLLVAGGVRVRRQVVADIARTAATLRGVTVTRATAHPRPGAPGAVDIALGLLVDSRTPLPELARRVRQAVRTAVRRALGPTDVQVDLTALDLLDQD